MVTLHRDPRVARDIPSLERAARQGDAHETVEELQVLIRDAINKLLNERVSFGGVEDVYITALVLQ